MIDAEYQCRKCLYLFHSEPRPPGQPPVAPDACPSCGHKYFEWRNSEAMNAAKFK